MNILKHTAILAGTTMLAVAAPAMAQVVDFEATPNGAITDGTNIGGIVWTSNNGTGLQVLNLFESNNTNGLVAFTDFNNNFIKGAIAGGASAISMDFGNDQLGFAAVGDLATLSVFQGATLVNTVTVGLNLDDMMNQTIGYSGSFDNFSFAYTNSGGGLINLIEVIDNVRFTAGAAVPEPATWAMMLLGFGLVGAAMRRKPTARVRFAF